MNVASDNLKKYKYVQFHKTLHQTLKAKKSENVMRYIKVAPVNIPMFCNNNPVYADDLLSIKFSSIILFISENHTLTNKKKHHIITRNHPCNVNLTSRHVTGICFNKICYKAKAPIFIVKSVLKTFEVVLYNIIDAVKLSNINSLSYFVKQKDIGIQQELNSVQNSRKFKLSYRHAVRVVAIYIIPLYKNFSYFKSLNRIMMNSNKIKENTFEINIVLVFYIINREQADISVGQMAWELRNKQRQICILTDLKKYIYASCNSDIYVDYVDSILIT
ncbi:hypothetical protein AGLY_006390 [Aphis glycines]|uniref:Uncharacterized protein n=1 Tax=Aphis glycines TaxID=307491 RepID=A0A6G0TQX9_APHGL|nr:hypothetical protein AGLY_006390 [Aphis glycines]